MGSIFDIQGEMQELYLMGTDPDIDPQVFADTLEALKGELEIKSCGYVQVIKQMDMEAKQAEEVSMAFAEKAKVRKNNIKRMKDTLQWVMETQGLKEMPAGAWTIKLQKNGGVAPLEITGEVPQNMTKVIVEPDNDKIREYLKDNECDWAHLGERGQHIVIK